MTKKLDIELARLLRHAAVVLLRPVKRRDAWPEWMTARKRRSMAMDFRAYAKMLRS